MTKRLVVFVTAVMTTLLALVVLWQFRVVIIYVLISLALAAALRPLAARLARRGFMARAAWILLYLVAVGSFGCLLFLAGENAITEIQLLAQTVSTQDTWRLPIWLEGSSFQLALVAQLPTPGKLFEALTGDQGQLVLPALLGFTQGIGDVLSGVLIILFLSIYWSLSQTHFERLWLSLLPSGQRKQARGIWRTIEVDLGAYIRSEVVQSLLAGLLLGLGYWLLGSPYPSLLALIGALAWLIPVVGALLAVILPLLMGLLTGVQLSLITALYTLLTLVILLAMADAFGLIGILVAPPLSAVCQILWNLLVSNRAVLGAAALVSDLKERQAHVWETVAAMDEPPLELVTNSLEASIIIAASPPLCTGWLSLSRLTSSTSNARSIRYCGSSLAEGSITIR